MRSFWINETNNHFQAKCFSCFVSVGKVSYHCSIWLQSFGIRSFQYCAWKMKIVLQSTIKNKTELKAWKKCCPVVQDKFFFLPGKQLFIFTCPIGNPNPNPGKSSTNWIKKKKTKLRFAQGKQIWELLVRVKSWNSSFFFRALSEVYWHNHSYIH